MTDESRLALPDADGGVSTMTGDWSRLTGNSDVCIVTDYWSYMIVVFLW